jgi:plasmid maintenance system antidote protein VapI
VPLSSPLSTKLNTSRKWISQRFTCTRRRATYHDAAMNEKPAFGGSADVWLGMQAAHDLAMMRQSEEAIRL